ncbi:DUF4233 domain-containing protein [Georgenia sp. MJ206]|uniref:DUF4233 domain-containing protein n=1 Tax=Georgenia wangjunii TaxID=3117730 RepID=UPI002F266B34
MSGAAESGDPQSGDPQSGAARSGAAARGAGAPARPRRSARALFATTILVLEAFVVFFAALVAFGLRVAEPAVVFGVGGGVALLCVLAAGLVRRGRAGYALGWAVQGVLLLCGFVLGAMFAIGAVFLLVWVSSLRVGTRIDAERVERERAEAGLEAGPTAPGPGGAGGSPGAPGR